MKMPTMKTKQGDDSTTSTVRVQEKGLYEFSIFAAAVVTGTACSIASKILYDTTDAVTGKHFDKPLAQTLAMFIAMIFGLPLHWIVICCKIPFPGYDRFVEVVAEEADDADDDDAAAAQDAAFVDQDRTPRIRGFKSTREERQPLTTNTTVSALAAAANTSKQNHDDDIDIDNDNVRIPIKTYFYLIIPALFDCVATVLCMVGLLYLDVSIYQLLRGSGIIFVALLRQYALHQRLYTFQWVGVGWNVVSVILVGATALLDASTNDDPAHHHQHKANNNNNNNNGENYTNNLHQAVIGVAFMLSGTLVQSMMFVFEEKVMRQDEIRVPPLLLFGMEGAWGALLTIVFLYPIGYYIPGHDHGSFENAWTTWEMLTRTPAIQWVMTIYCMAVFLYNLLAVLVTFSLSSVWHSILDNYRPLTVWITDLFIYYYVSTDAGSFGEPWTKYSWMQLVGTAVLIYGTAIYNAPDIGSIRLCGEWFSLGMNFSEEYNEIQAQRIFSMGSYPSLQRFMSASGQSSSSPQRIGESLSWRERGSPKMHHDATLSSQRHSM